MEETHGIKVQFSVDDGATWKDMVALDGYYSFINPVVKKKTLNLVKRLAVKAIIYAATHN